MFYESLILNSNSGSIKQYFDKYNKTFNLLTVS